MGRKLTVRLTDENAVLLERIAQHESRSLSGTLTLLLRTEAAKRGLLGRAPAIVPSECRQDGGKATAKP